MEWAWLIPIFSFAAAPIIVVFGRFLPTKGALLSILAIAATKEINRFAHWCIGTSIVIIDYTITISIIATTVTAAVTTAIIVGTAVIICVILSI